AYASLAKLDSYLLIFDNVKSHDSVIGFLPTAPQYIGYKNQANRFHCLITSRDRRGWAEVIEIKGFNEDSFNDYVEKFLSPAALGFTLTDLAEEKQRFGEALGYHPLALTQAACLLRRRAAKRFARAKFTSLKDYLQALEATPTFVLTP